MDVAQEKELVEAVMFIKDRMVTKDELADVRTELKGDIAGVKNYIRRVDEKLENFMAHEIDARKVLEVRVSTLENAK